MCTWGEVESNRAVFHHDLWKLVFHAMLTETIKLHFIKIYLTTFFRQSQPTHRCVFMITISLSNTLICTTREILVFSVVVTCLLYEQSAEWCSDVMQSHLEKLAAWWPAGEYSVEFNAPLEAFCLHKCPFSNRMRAWRSLTGSDRGLAVAPQRTTH